MSSIAGKFRLDGRVAVVVGAGSGIGLASARGLAESGARVICADVGREAAAEAAEGIRAASGQADAIVLDVRESTAVDAAMQGIATRFGRVDVVVSTPAMNVRKPLLDTTTEEFERVLRLNLTGNFHVAQAAGRQMREQKAGSIILLSSIRSLTVEPGQATYAATKAGIVQMARGLASELGPHGVRVNCIAPGVVDTPLTAPIQAKPEWYAAYANKSALGRWAKPEEIAAPVVFLASDAASYVTGAVLFVDGGWTAIDGRFTPPL